MPNGDCTVGAKYQARADIMEKDIDGFRECQKIVIKNEQRIDNMRDDINLLITDIRIIKSVQEKILIGVATACVLIAINILLKEFM